MIFNYQRFKDDLKYLTDAELALCAQTRFGTDGYTVSPAPKYKEMYNWLAKVVDLYQTGFYMYGDWWVDLTEAFYEEQERRESNRIALSEAWRQHWPGHCTKCFGAGGFLISNDPYFDVCEGSENITDIKDCHRCGKRGCNEEGEGPCFYCAWQNGNGPDDIMPSY